jgi:hypothetical protein
MSRDEHESSSWMAPGAVTCRGTLYCAMDAPWETVVGELLEGYLKKNSSKVPD